MDKTPWNPSRSATKRVKSPLPAPEQCNFCGRMSVVIKNNAYIYGRSYGDWPWVYICAGESECCGAYVGMHPFTNIPLGTLADAKTRTARKKCKAPFEALHQTGKISRGEAYEKLAEKLGIKKEQCHFGWFDADMCEKAAQAARDIYLTLQRSR